jgi:hypothetical protein
MDVRMLSALARGRRHHHGRRNRAVPIPRCWDQASRDERKATVARKPGAPRRTRISRNPLRRECRCSGGTCRYLRAQKCTFFARKARGCGQHPAFPAPSRFWAPRMMHHSGMPCRGNADARQCEERVGWVERKRNPSFLRLTKTVGFASLYPPYGSGACGRPQTLI